MGANKSTILQKENRNSELWELSLTDVNDESDLKCHKEDYNTLTHLKITHSTVIPGSVGRFEHLTHLNLSNNGLDLVPRFIVYLKQLQVLNLSHNELRKLPQNMFDFQELISLDLSYNLFEHLPTNLLMYTSLQNLNVEGNQKLVSPPLDVCLQGKDAIFKELLRQIRTNVWASWRPHTGKLCLKTLVEICIDSILNSDIDYLAVRTIPPTVKKYIATAEETHSAVYLMKCSNCGGYFTKRHIFENHYCKAPHPL